MFPCEESSLFDDESSLLPLLRTGSLLVSTFHWIEGGGFERGAGVRLSHSFSGWKKEGRMPLERRIPLTVECAFLIDSKDSSFLEKNKCMKKRQRI